MTLELEIVGKYGETKKRQYPQKGMTQTMGALLASSPRKSLFSEISLTLRRPLYRCKRTQEDGKLGSIYSSATISVLRPLKDSTGTCWTRV